MNFPKVVIHPDKKDQFGRPLRTWACGICGEEFPSHGKRMGHQLKCEYDVKTTGEFSPKAEAKQEVDRENELVEITVRPEVKIAGKAYFGLCKVPRKLVGTITYLMEQARKQMDNVSKSKDHGMKSFGEYSGKLR